MPSSAFSNVVGGAKSFEFGGAGVRLPWSKVGWLVGSVGVVMLELCKTRTVAREVFSWRHLSEVSDGEAQKTLLMSDNYMTPSIAFQYLEFDRTSQSPWTMW